MAEEQKNPYTKIHSEIRINDGFATVYESLYRTTRKADSKPRIRKLSLPFDLMYAKLSKAMTGYTGLNEAAIVPENCRYHEFTSGHHIVAVEERPAVRTVLISSSYVESLLLHMQNDLKAGKINRDTLTFYEKRINNINKGMSTKFGGAPLKLSFPYVILLLCFSRRGSLFERAFTPHVFFKRTSIYGLGDPLLIAPLGNVTGEHELCIGSGTESNEDMLLIKRNLDSYIKHIRKLFWNNVFNTDFQSNLRIYADAGIDVFKDYVQWNFLTEENPSFIYTAQFKKSVLDLGGAISIIRQRISSHHHNNSNINNGKYQYRIMEDALLTPFNSGLPVNGTKDEFVFDSTNEYYLNDNISIMTGDLLTLPNKRTILFESFLSTTSLHLGKTTHMCLKINNKKRIIMKINSRFINFLINSIENATSLSKIKTAHGVFKIGDVITGINEYTGKEMIITIKSIKIKGDNSIDIISTGGVSHLLSSLSTFSKLDIKKLYYGKNIFKLENIKNREILFEPSPINKGDFITYGFKAKFAAIEFDSRTNNFVGLFKRVSSSSSPSSVSSHSSSSPISRYFVSLTSSLITEDYRITGGGASGYAGYYDPNLTGDIISIDKKIPINTGGGGLRLAKNTYYRHPNSFRIFIDNIHDDTSSSMFDSKERLFQSLNDMISQGELHITSIGKNINFKIGDNIVVFDRNPLKMLEPRKIIDIKYFSRDSDDTIQFITKNRLDEIETVDYIINQSIVGLSKVRKIVGDMKDLKHGFKIKSKVDNIPCFPKDSTNIIIGFITDTISEPMVLLSNAKTLWFSDINTNNFDIIKPSNKEYRTLEHAGIDPKDFIFQCGDIVTFSEYAACASGFNGIIAIECLRSRPEEPPMPTLSNFENECHVHIQEDFSIYPHYKKHHLIKMDPKVLTLAAIPSPRLPCYNLQPNRSLSHSNPQLLTPTFLGEFIAPSQEDLPILKHTRGTMAGAYFSSEHRRINV